MDDPKLFFAIACEADGDREAICRLADRVLESKIDWFGALTRDHVRAWCGPDAATSYWPVKTALKRARELGLPTRGHFDDVAQKPEAGMIRAQLLLLKRTHDRWERGHVDGRRIDGAVIARDTDDHEDRLDGAKQAVGDGARWPFRIVLAYPHPELEAWFVAGFEATTSHERERIADITKRLGFSPIERPEELTSTNDDAGTDAKDVLDHLTADSADRQRACLEHDLEALRARGKSCNLAMFLEAVETELVPLF